MRSLIAALAVAGLAASSVHAQTPPPQTPPLTLTAQSIVGRQITLEEAVAIALEGQPQIVARLADYQAARFRVDQTLAPLLPQLTGSWTAARTQSVTTNDATSTRGAQTVTSWATNTNARITLSQILFDFGKNFASIESARKQADVALEDIELQRQLIAFTVKESYTNMLFSQRLIRVNQQALERAELNLRSARGFFDVGTRPKSDVTRAEVDVANARVDVIRARNADRHRRQPRVPGGRHRPCRHADGGAAPAARIQADQAARGRDRSAGTPRLPRFLA
jgi:outer membrane protein